MITNAPAAARYRPNVITALVLAGLGAGIVLCAERVRAQPADPANAFLQNMIIAERFEIDASRLALSNSTNADVQRSAGDIATESQGLLDRLTNLAKSMNVAPPTELDVSRRAWLQDLQKKHGAEFEQAYWEHQLEAYAQARAECRNYEREGNNPDLRKTAAEVDTTIVARQNALKAQRGL